MIVSTNAPASDGTRPSAATAMTTKRIVVKVEYLWIGLFNIFDGEMTVAYRKVSNIRRTLVGNKIVDHSDVVGASPVGAAPTTSSFST